MTKKLMKGLRLALLPLLAAVVLPAQAQYPEKTIRIIVPFEPGGANDIMARVTAPNLAKVLNQMVIVENRPGAGGNIGAAFVAKGPADGYTLLFTAGGATQNPAMFRNINYDPIADITPAAVLGYGPHIFVINPKLPFRSIREVVDYARKNPGKLNAAAGGATTRLESEMFQIQNGVKVEIIPYSGTGRASQAVLAGEADFVIMDTSPVVSLIKAGKLRGLGIIGEERHPAMPDIPTVKEQGYPDFLGGITFGAYIPMKTPRDIAQKLNTSLNRVMLSPEMKEWFDKVGAKPINMNLEEARAWYLKELAVWKDVVTKAKIPYAD
jgi:tripartite-type tricarboxylate transporter receptor subunit TctC